MRDDRLEFYDPLYETIVFERGLPPAGWVSEYPLDPRDIVQTAEFARLAFLNQVGLAWLVFPSATHTRFAHSIGCWWLGRIAESLIKVGPRDTGTSLHRWLEMRGLREEFYLALLLHDVGHGPLSHVLERNETFVEVLRGAGVANWQHEHRGAELLLGAGPIADAWREIARERYGSRPTFFELRSELSQVKGLNIHAVCFLMTGNEAFLGGCGDKDRTDLELVKELVSGLLDLDRLDHYARDSYFSGLRQVSINVRGFLTNIRVEPDPDGTLIYLSRDGVAAAASLLFNKRQILSTMFRHPKTVSLHAMANASLGAFLQGIGAPASRLEAALRIVWMEDHQFLETMARSDNPLAQGLIRRIRSLDPYAFVGRWVRSDLSADLRPADIQQFLARTNRAGAEQVIVHYDDDFWLRGRAADPKDWLDSSRLIAEDTRQAVTEHPEHKEEFAFLREAARRRCVWFFCAAPDDAEPIRADLIRFFGARPV